MNWDWATFNDIIFAWTIAGIVIYFRNYNRDPETISTLETGVLLVLVGPTIWLLIFCDWVLNKLFSND